MGTNFDKESWLAEIEQSRVEAADYLLSDFDWRSAKMPSGFKGPIYYPPNERWRVSARLDKEAAGTVMHVQLQTSIGDLRDFHVEGTFVFSLDGEKQQLTAYRMIPAHADFNELFVPFRDVTSGKETYGAGRYLDIPAHNGNVEYVLDFNKAYNPLCAYSPRYNCPYPPPQNHLKIAIEAGEKIPFEH
ncbi:MAG: DUF1684 domain-containing protein [Chloroflexi bacterium]|nr:DUF1684 domain-containing protein [Chloroflexota bacterium]